MQWQGVHVGSLEWGTGRFFMTKNEWVNDLGVSSGKNLKGCAVWFDSTSSLLALQDRFPNDVEKYMGKTCSIPASSGGGIPDYLSEPLGILLDDMIIDQMPIEDVWVNVLVYGWAERIMVYSDVEFDEDHQFIVTDSSRSGYCRTAPSAGVSGTIGLVDGTGQLVTDGNAFTLDWSGPKTGGALFWAPPQFGVTDPNGNTSGANFFHRIGSHVVGDPLYVPQELAEGRAAGYQGYRCMRGFIRCMGGGSI